MPSKALSPELKLAILEMPQKEKDKILLRLIAKDDLLVEQLEHKLLENEEDVIYRRELLKSTIVSSMSALAAQNRFNDRTHSRIIRNLSSKITRLLKVTKDKPGEIELYIILILHYLIENGHRLASQDAWNCIRTSKVISDKIFKVFGLLEKIHEDYKIEYRDNLEEISKLLDKQNQIKLHLEDRKITMEDLIEL